MEEKGIRQAPLSADISSASRNIDETYNVYKQHLAEDENQVAVDEDESRRVLRKIDMRLLPLMMGSYFLQYIDKSSINFASVYGLQEDTNLHGQQYSWLSSIFYFGYMFAQYPAGYALQRLPTGKFIGACTFGWGVLMLTIPACTNFAGIAANRFLLGALEAIVNPGFVLVLAIWYQVAEQPLRLVTYYSMNGIAGIVGPLIGYAIGHITTGPPKWMYVFLIFGSVSLAWGIIFFFFMPDLPSSAKFLSEREKVVAVHRVALNRQGVKNPHFKKYQVWQTLKDPKTWILFFMSIAAQIPNAAQTTFTSIILKTFGYTTLETQYMQIPSGVIQIVSLLLGGWVASRWPNMRCMAMFVGNMICVVAGGVLVGLNPGPDGTENRWGRLVALWLCATQSVGFSLSLTMVSSNVAGYTKKQLTGAFVFVGYCVGNIIGPQTFIDSEFPLYKSAYIAILIGYSFKTLLVLVLYGYMWSVNKKRDREALALSQEGGSGATNVGLRGEDQEKEAIELGMQDITEIDNKGFRYSL
ncbi:MFS general substrate transporter [Sarocladium strictum]